MFHCDFELFSLFITFYVPLWNKTIIVNVMVKEINITLRIAIFMLKIRKNNF